MNSYLNPIQSCLIIKRGQPLYRLEAVYFHSMGKTKCEALNIIKKTRFFFYNVKQTGYFYSQPTPVCASIVST